MRVGKEQTTWFCSPVGYFLLLRCEKDDQLEMVYKGPDRAQGSVMGRLCWGIDILLSVQLYS